MGGEGDLFPCPEKSHSHIDRIAIYIASRLQDERPALVPAPAPYLPPPRAPPRPPAPPSCGLPRPDGGRKCRAGGGSQARGQAVRAVEPGGAWGGAPGRGRDRVRGPGGGGGGAGPRPRRCCSCSRRRPRGRARPPGVVAGLAPRTPSAALAAVMTCSGARQLSPPETCCCPSLPAFTCNPGSASPSP